MRQLPDNITMVARCDGVLPSGRTLWECELHLEGSAVCLPIEHKGDEPPEIDLVWRTLQILVQAGPIHFPPAFWPGFTNPSFPKNPASNS